MNKKINYSTDRNKDSFGNPLCRKCGEAIYFKDRKPYDIGTNRLHFISCGKEKPKFSQKSVIEYKYDQKAVKAISREKLN